MWHDSITHIYWQSCKLPIIYYRPLLHETNAVWQICVITEPGYVVFLMSQVVQYVWCLCWYWKKKQEIVVYSWLLARLRCFLSKWWHCANLKKLLNRSVFEEASIVSVIVKEGMINHHSSNGKQQMHKFSVKDSMVMAWLTLNLKLVLVQGAVSSWLVWFLEFCQDTLCVTTENCTSPARAYL